MSFRIVPLVKGYFPQIALYRPVLLFGRHPECDARIDSPKVSRRHCCVAIAYDRVLIRDLGSRNGVRVNGRLLEEATLHSGDEVAIGPILFRLEEESDQPPAQVRPVAAARFVAAGSGACREPLARPRAAAKLSWRLRCRSGAARRRLKVRALGRLDLLERFTLLWRLPHPVARNRLNFSRNRLLPEPPLISMI